MPSTHDRLKQFALEGEMLVGIALAVDWDAAYGSATQKRIQ
jgi:hypothetical protein